MTASENLVWLLLMTELCSDRVWIPTHYILLAICSGDADLSRVLFYKYWWIMTVPCCNNINYWHLLGNSWLKWQWVLHPKAPSVLKTHINFVMNELATPTWWHRYHRSKWLHVNTPQYTLSLQLVTTSYSLLGVSRSVCCDKANSERAARSNV